MYDHIRVGDKVITSRYLVDLGPHRGKKGIITVADYDRGVFVITLEDGQQIAARGFGLIKYGKYSEWWK